MEEVEMEEKPYIINSPSFSGAVAALVEQFKAQNPEIGEFSCVCHDGTTVAIKIEAKRPKVRRAGRAGGARAS